MKIVILAILCIVCAAYDPSKVLISFNVDDGHSEVVYEAVRLAMSIREFGGSLNRAKVALCISSRNMSKEGILTSNRPMQLLNKFKRILNVSCYSFQPSYYTKGFAASLNKLSSFRPSCMKDDDILVYLDSDIFVTSDPYALLSRYLDQSTEKVYCGRPWNTFTGLETFDRFVALESPIMDEVIETISLQGRTLKSMCNTGMIMLNGSSARRLHSEATRYLDKATTLWDDELAYREAYSVEYFGIDSVVIWASLYSLGFGVEIVSPLLNYIAAAEDQLRRFLRGGDEDLLPVFLHLSSGSWLEVTQGALPIFPEVCEEACYRQEWHDMYQFCFVKLSARLANESKLFAVLDDLFKAANAEICWRFLSELEDVS